MELTSCSWQSLLLFIPLSLCLAASLIFLLNSCRRRGKSLPPGPPALLFLAKFLALRQSIFDLPQILRELHARHGPVISVRLFRPLVFVSDRHLAHRVLVQSGVTFADRPQVFEPGHLFTSGARNINAAPYGPYWRLVRRNLASEVLHPARVSLFAPARRRARDTLVNNLLAASGGGGSRPVTVRPLLRRALFELFAYMSFGARLGPEVLDEIQELQLWVVRSILSYPIFYIFPPLTKRLFRKRWAAHMAVRRRVDEILLPLRASPLSPDDNPPCYAESLLGLRVPREGDRPLTDGEVVSLQSGSDFWASEDRTRRIVRFQDCATQVWEFRDFFDNTLAMIYSALFPRNPQSANLIELMDKFKDVESIHDFVKAQLIAGAKFALIWLKICYSKLDLDTVFDTLYRKTSKRRVNADKHSEAVSPVAEKMIDELLQYDAAFFTDHRYDDSTQIVRTARENITIDRFV
ncbi:cytochrome P450 89A9-like [Lolium rigidum]|uniref:cytochrome P450 89A9-like n=1 Tax=Lolium rigidum TaxID=89674 RepID=UPI001F5D9A3A|nr:cytochrome P450 89A9-like [Lolium rigidum]